MSVISKIGSRGQITLPKDIRKRFNFQPGQRIAFVIKNDQLTLLPLEHTVFDFEGVLDAPEVDLDTLQKTVKEEQAKRIALGE